MKHNFFFKLLITFVFSSMALMGYAADWYISTSGNDATGNGTAGNPWASFSKAQTAAASGDVIKVSGMIDFTLDPANTTTNAGTTTSNKAGIIITKSLTIQGTSASTDGFSGTNGANTTRFFQITNTNYTLTLKNLKLVNGVAQSTSNVAGGGAIMMTTGNVVAENVIFDNNSAIGYTSITGAAVYIGGSNTGTSFKNCTFSNNKADKSGAIYVNTWATGTALAPSMLIFENCSFVGNEAKNTGGSAMMIRSGNEYTTLNVINCTFSKNKVTTASNGGTINLGAKGMRFLYMNFINCTVTENTTTGSNGNGAGLVYLNTVQTSTTTPPANNNIGNLYIKNTIIENNTTTAGAFSDLIVNAQSPTVPETGINATSPWNNGVPGYIKIENSLIGQVTNPTFIPSANIVASQVNYLTAISTSSDFKAKFGDFNTIKNYYPLLATSTAIDYGAKSFLSAVNVTTDQLGNTRPFTNDKCYAGAVEVKEVLANANVNVSDLGTTPLTDLIITANEVNINQPTAVNSITISAGAKVTVTGTNALSATKGITLESDANGTATLVDSYSAPTVTATVKQYVTAGRNWYLSAPTNSTSNVSVLNRGASVQEFNETSGLWQIASGTLTRGKGYIQVATSSEGNTGTVSFNGVTNSGNVPVTLTNNSGGGNGFNLVGNPYPSYLSWSAVCADANNIADANMPTGTMWYRTISYNSKNAWAASTAYNVDDVVYNGTRFYRATSAGTSASTGGPTGGVGTTGIVDGTVTWAYEGSIYIFATVNSAGQVSPASVSNLVPPMQAFWVKSNGGTLTFKNTMRQHETITNKLKAPKNNAGDLQSLRINVSNGASADETLIYANTNASNAFDSQDSPKYFNYSGSNQPEIYSLIGNEKLAINAMNELVQGTEIPLGFATEKANNFSISASEINNFSSDMQVLLKDKQTSNEFNLANGQTYHFSSQPTTSADRFSLIFRSAGTTTGIKATEKANTQVFVNATNQITIIAPEKSNYTIYNAVGQIVENGAITTNYQTANCKLASGVYVVKVNNQSTRVIIK